MDTHLRKVKGVSGVLEERPVGMPTSKEKREYEVLERRTKKVKEAQERGIRKVSRSRMWPTV